MVVTVSKIRMFLLPFLLVLFAACGRSSAGPETLRENPSVGDAAPAGEHAGRLQNELSPYLQQHADNPVDWYPWGEDAFARARSEDKPVFLSIGYATCHWCHVMEEESFEDPAIAAILNDQFVSVKVDREERPDIDHIYMGAVAAMTGRGGWPLSVFLTPDGRPFFGGTYFPPEPQHGLPGFSQVLTDVAQEWQGRRDEVLAGGDVLMRYLKEQSAPPPDGEDQELSVTVLDEAFQAYQEEFDNIFGGFGPSPKFPSPQNLSFLLRYFNRTGNPAALSMVTTTLDAIVAGGIHDQAGGGFHRYSTGRDWRVPHFEKMLYDQALMARVLLEAYQVTGKDSYARAARRTFDYVLRDLTGPEGAFYSAEDADSLPPGEVDAEAGRKKEGAHYLWTDEELTEHLTPGELAAVRRHFGIRPEGNMAAMPEELKEDFGSHNILHETRSRTETAAELGISTEELDDLLSSALHTLFSVRTARPRPLKDDKILTDWNGLMISSLAYGAGVLRESRFRRAAESAAQFILQNLQTADGALLHRYRSGRASIPGMLDDYAFLIQGLLDLYEVTLKFEYLKAAHDLAVRMQELFADPDAPGLYLTPADGEALLVRPKAVYDGALPSGNAVAAHDLVRLSHMLIKPEWEDAPRAWLTSRASQLSSAAVGHGQALIALDHMMGPSQEIVLTGPVDDDQTLRMQQFLYDHYFPRQVLVLRPVDPQAAAGLLELVPFYEDHRMFNEKTTAYVCENFQCLLPTSDFGQYQRMVRKEVDAGGI